MLPAMEVDSIESQDTDLYLLAMPQVTYLVVEDVWVQSQNTPVGFTIIVLYCVIIIIIIIIIIITFVRR